VSDAEQLDALAALSGRFQRHGVDYWFSRRSSHHPLSALGSHPIKWDSGPLLRCRDANAIKPALP